MFSGQTLVWVCSPRWFLDAFQRALSASGRRGPFGLSDSFGSGSSRGPRAEVMPCFGPVEVPRRGFTDLRVTVACGRCIGCRIDRQRDVAMRCVHESMLHDVSSFVTLTYDDEHLPPFGSLRPRDFQLFMKRLRSARSGQRIRFFHAGEYGKGPGGVGLGRPHDHGLLFGADFPDKRLIAGTLERGKPRWTSEELESLWGMGRCDIGVVNSRTAAYCAGYLLKKIGGDRAVDHYGIVDPSTGEFFQRLPEYSTRSLKPGLGAEFFERFAGDVFPGDFCATVDGKQVPVPEYYDKLLLRKDPELYASVKAQRFAYAMSPRQQANGTPSRLAVRAEVARAKLALRKSAL